jgi:RNA polymerase sigma-70 factor (ECF subfamily)
MTDAVEIDELVDRVRAGDQAAASELVRKYEPDVRRAIRLQLRDPRLRAVLDTADVCQSVLASFIARLALGQYELTQPRQVASLLMTMARCKVASRARRADVARRDRRGGQMLEMAVAEIADPGPTVMRLVVGRDLLEQFQNRLSSEERALSDRRIEGRSWPEIAAELGSTPEALRKKLSRALDRIACELGLDDPNDLWSQPI